MRFNEFLKKVLSWGRTFAGHVMKEKCLFVIVGVWRVIRFLPLFFGIKQNSNEKAKKLT